MKTLFTLLLIIVSTCTAFAQSTTFNLKDLVKFKVSITDGSESLSEKTMQKMASEIKLKLITLGLKFVDEENVPNLVIETSIIRSSMAAHRVLVQLYLEEQVSTTRKTNVKTQAITYYDKKFFQSSTVGTDIYSVVMDDLLVKLIDQLMEAK